MLHIPTIHPPHLVFLQISLHLSAFVCRQLSSEDLARVPANSTSNILNRLLVSYDPRIRPNFKGKTLSLASLFLFLIGKRIMQSELIRKYVRQVYCISCKLQQQISTQKQTWKIWTIHHEDNNDVQMCLVVVRDHHLHTEKQECSHNVKHSFHFPHIFQLTIYTNLCEIIDCCLCIGILIQICFFFVFFKKWAFRGCY